MAYTLVGVGGPETGRHFPLGSKPTVIGRGSEADLFLDAEGASREHCIFSSSETGNLLLENYGSRNGTKVNNDKITTKTTVQAGDRISVGNYRCTICDDRHNGSMRLLV